jgi:uncharacterized protein (DUF342 family)
MGQGQTIYNLEIAKCQLPERGTDAKVELFVKGINKKEIFDINLGLSPTFEEPEYVSPNRLIAVLYPATSGKHGVSISGKFIPAIKGSDLNLTLQWAKQKKEEDAIYITAERYGYVVLDDTILSVEKFFVIYDDITPQTDLGIGPGSNLIVFGNVVGDVKLRVRDIFICGRVEEACISTTKDVYVKDGIVGRKKTVIDCGGRIYTKFISDASIFALGDIIVEQAINYSDVTTSKRVVLKSKGSSIVGGDIKALHGVIAERLGSEFGIFTSLSVGKNFLRDTKLDEIKQKLEQVKKTYEKVLYLKESVSRGKVDVKKLPPDKQDLLLSILDNEQRLLEEVHELEELYTKVVSSAPVSDITTIQVKKELLPPIKVQMKESVEEIQSSLKGVQMHVDKDGKIVFDIIKE